jgi:hypothetical protein
MEEINNGDEKHQERRYKKHNGYEGSGQGACPGQRFAVVGVHGRPGRGIQKAR